MAHPEICDISECIAFLGLGTSITDADRGLLQMLKGMVEDDVREYVKHNITQPTTPYTHFLPANEHNSLSTGEVEKIGNSVLLTRTYEAGDRLQLPQTFARNDASLVVYEDPAAYGGQGSSDFPESTLLTKGTHYILDVDEGTLSRSGQLIRIRGAWSSEPRTIKVTYNAGFSAAELDGTYRNLKYAVIREICQHFSSAKSRQGADGKGPVKSESIGGEYSMTYAVVEPSMMSGLSPQCKRALHPYLNYGGFVG